ncbi:MAG: SDR family NAD(P)-dependent oxidoreductase [Pseudomonadota bacterium]
MPHAVITGSTGGIGGEITTLLAERGFSLTLLNRAPQKAAAQQEALKAGHGGLTVRTVTTDLMDLDSISAAAADLAADGTPIDVLYQISGVLTSEKKLSKQGFESHYAVNVLAPYALTKALLPLLKRDKDAAPSMIVTMSSSIVSSAKALDIEALPNPAKIGGLFGAYAASKTALTTMGAALAESLRADGVMIRSIDPGATRTPMTKSGDGMPTLVRWLSPILFAKADKQALKVVNAADPTAFAGRSGNFVSNGKEKALPKPAKDKAVQKALIARLEADLTAHATAPA